MKTRIKDEVNKQVEGKCLGREGYVIAVTSVKDEDVDTGVVEYDTGCVAVNVRYAAILLRPFKNEVLDAIVDDVSELGVFTSVGPLHIFVSRHAMPEDLQNGFDADSDAWLSDDKEVEIKKAEDGTYEVEMDDWDAKVGRCGKGCRCARASGSAIWIGLLRASS